MAEDGMLLNFSLDETLPFAQKENLKGGSWRARRQAQRAAQHTGQRQQGSRRVRESDVGYREVRRHGEKYEDGKYAPPAKRRRLELGSADVNLKHGGKVPAKENHAPAKQVVSSLFRFNPASTTKVSVTQVPPVEEHIEPSNAPLSAEAENFTALGVSPTLARHLTEKLNIKKPTAIQKAAIIELLKGDGDAFIQAETGSGKTFAYLLPLVEQIMNLSNTGAKTVSQEHKTQIHRDSGLFAIILAPTRELARQISAVLDSLLRCAHWIVSGIVTGGEKKKSEKARLRKGLNVLIATPGRLADHLQHTESLDVGQVRWLVLDEGDRLVELGFEEDITKIISALDFRMSKAKKEGTVLKGLPEKRMTVLCSATLKMDVQRLGEICLNDAQEIRVDVEEQDARDINEQKADQSEREFLAPAQLKQSYAVVPAKQRLVTLMAFLRSQFARKGSVNKIIVFASCADSVDFHFDVFSRPAETLTQDGGLPNLEERKTNRISTTTSHSKPPDPTSSHSYHLSSKSNDVTVFRLHGSLEQKLRTSTIKAFHACETPAVLMCTDVASRGLDVPNVDLVIEFDPAFSRDEHLHRIGRTARAGQKGRAMVFLMPGCEEGYVEVLSKDRREGAFGLRRVDADEILKRSFSTGTPTAESVRHTKGELRDWEEAATDWQLEVERWALAEAQALEKARKAYQSHVRAYATHVTAERSHFDIKQLHLGHLAKAFALRDRPGSINVPGMRGSSTNGKEKRKPVNGASRKFHMTDNTSVKVGQKRDAEDDAPIVTDVHEAARKMRAISKMNMTGASEFNLG